MPVLTPRHAQIQDRDKSLVHQCRTDGPLRLPSLPELSEVSTAALPVTMTSDTVGLTEVFTLEETESASSRRTGYLGPRP